jgi:hypothetical protein
VQELGVHSKTKAYATGAMLVHINGDDILVITCLRCGESIEDSMEKKDGKRMNKDYL